MKKRIFLPILTMLCAVIALCCVATLGFNKVEAETVTPTYFAMQTGASVRSDGKNGLRFTAEVDEETALAVKNSPTMSFGGLIVPYDYLTDKDISVGDTEYIDVLTDAGYTISSKDRLSISPKLNENGYRTVSFTILVNKLNTNRDFFGVIYINTDNGPIYATTSETNQVRNVSTVANNLLKSEDPTISDTAREVLQSYVTQSVVINKIKKEKGLESEAAFRRWANDTAKEQVAPGATVTSTDVLNIVSSEINTQIEKIVEAFNGKEGHEGKQKETTGNFEENIATIFDILTEEVEEKKVAETLNKEVLGEDYQILGYDDLSVEFVSSDENILSVSETGLVTFLAEGGATVTVKALGGEQVISFSVTDAGNVFKNGKTIYKVVKANGLSGVEKNAVNRLVSYINKSTNVELEVVTEDKVSAYNPLTKYIYVGLSSQAQTALTTSELSAIGTNGYIVAVKGNNIILTGKNHDQGTSNAVNAFLNQTIDFEYFTGDEANYTAKTSILLDEIEDDSKTPVLNSYGEGGSTRSFLAGLTHYSIEYLNNVIEGPYHNALRIVNPDAIPDGETLKLKELHPLWFDDADDPKQLCYTAHGNATERQALLNYVYAYMKGIYDDAKEECDKLVTIAFTQMDNYTLCDCDGCKANNVKSKYNSSVYVDSRRGGKNYSINVIEFMNDLSDKFAVDGITGDDVQLEFFAYMDTEAAPTVASGVRLNANVIPLIAPIYPNFVREKGFVNNGIKTLVQQWQAISESGKFDLWTYCANYQNFLAPIDNISELTGNYTWLAQEAAAGRLVSWREEPGGQGGGVVSDTGFGDFRLWLKSKLAWDVNYISTNVKLKAAAKEFFDVFYGSASDLMQDFYLGTSGYSNAYLPKVKSWVNNYDYTYTDTPCFNQTEQYNGARYSIIGFMTKALLNEWISKLDTAIAAATDEVWENRIKAEKAAIEFMLLKLYGNDTEYNDYHSLMISFYDDAKAGGVTRARESALVENAFTADVARYLTSGDIKQTYQDLLDKKNIPGYYPDFALASKIAMFDNQYALLNQYGTQFEALDSVKDFRAKYQTIYSYQDTYALIVNTNYGTHYKVDLEWDKNYGTVYAPIITRVEEGYHIALYIDNSMIDKSFLSTCDAVRFAIYNNTNVARQAFVFFDGSAHTGYKPLPAKSWTVVEVPVSFFTGNYTFVGMSYISDMDPGAGNKLDDEHNTPIKVSAFYGVKFAVSAKPVIDLIDALPLPVNVTADDRAQIEAARAAYDALSDGAKSAVTNYSKLTSAEEALSGGMFGAVIELIDALPATTADIDFLKDGVAIQYAKSEYDALTEGGKALVANADKLNTIYNYYINLSGVVFSDEDAGWFTEFASEQDRANKLCDSYRAFIKDVTTSTDDVYGKVSQLTYYKTSENGVDNNFSASINLTKVKEAINNSANNVVYVEFYIKSPASLYISTNYHSIGKDTWDDTFKYLALTANVWTKVRLTANEILNSSGAVRNGSIASTSDRTIYVSNFYLVKENAVIAEVEEAIGGLTAVANMTLADEASVVAARTAFDNLDAVIDNADTKVSNYDVLVAAEAKIDDLYISTVINAIANINTGVLKGNDIAYIYGARLMYEALPEALKSEITNLDVLVAAETAYAGAYDYAVLYDVTSASQFVGEDYGGGPIGYNAASGTMTAIKDTTFGNAISFVKANDNHIVAKYQNMPTVASDYTVFAYIYNGGSSAKSVSISYDQASSQTAAANAWSLISCSGDKFLGKLLIFSANTGVEFRISPVFKFKANAVQAVKVAIAEIPATVTLSDVATVNAARTAYNAFDGDTSLITNYSILEAAETTLANIVIGLGSNLPVKLFAGNDYYKIIGFEYLYNMLDAEAKAIVDASVPVATIVANFKSQYDVVVINDMTGTVNNSTQFDSVAAQYHHFDNTVISTALNGYVGPAIKIWNKDAGNIAGTFTYNANLTGYTIYITGYSNENARPFLTWHNGTTSTSGSYIVGSWSYTTRDGLDGSASAITLAIGVNQSGTYVGLEETNYYYLAPVYAVKKTAQADTIFAIDSIPAVDNITVADATAIKSARALYNALDAVTQAKVYNYQVLVDAEAKLTSISSVEMLNVINALPDSVEDVTVFDGYKVNEAIKVRGLLTQDQIDLIDFTKYDLIVNFYQARWAVDSDYVADNVMINNPDGSFGVIATITVEEDATVGKYFESTITNTSNSNAKYSINLTAPKAYVANHSEVTSVVVFATYTVAGDSTFNFRWDNGNGYSDPVSKVANKSGWTKFVFDVDTFNSLNGTLYLMFATPYIKLSNFFFYTDEGSLTEVSREASVLPATLAEVKITDTENVNTIYKSYNDLTATQKATYADRIASDGYIDIAGYNEYVTARWALATPSNALWIKPFNSFGAAVDAMGSDTYAAGSTADGATAEFVDDNTYGKLSRINIVVGQQGNVNHWAADFCGIENAKSVLNANSNYVAVEFYVYPHGISTIQISTNGNSAYTSFALSTDTWNKVTMTREQVLGTNGNIRKSYAAYNGNYLLVSQPYAVTTQAQADAIVDMINALSDITPQTVAEKDYLRILNVRNTYDGVSSTIQSAVTNYATFTAIETAFNAKFTVKTLFDMSSASPFTKKDWGSGRTEAVSVSTDLTYGNVLKIVPAMSATVAEGFTCTEDLSDYNTVCTFVYNGGDAKTFGLCGTSTIANGWNFVTRPASSFTTGTLYVDGATIGIQYLVSQIYAIKYSDTYYTSQFVNIVNDMTPAADVTTANFAEVYEEIAEAEAFIASSTASAKAVITASASYTTLTAIKSAVASAAENDLIDKIDLIPDVIKEYCGELDVAVKAYGELETYGGLLANITNIDKYNTSKAYYDARFAPLFSFDAVPYTVFNNDTFGVQLNTDLAVSDTYGPYMATTIKENANGHLQVRYDIATAKANLPEDATYVLFYAYYTSGDSTRLLRIGNGASNGYASYVSVTLTKNQWTKILLPVSTFNTLNGEIYMMHQANDLMLTNMYAITDLGLAADVENIINALPDDYTAITRYDGEKISALKSGIEELFGYLGGTDLTEFAKIYTADYTTLIDDEYYELDTMPIVSYEGCDEDSCNALQSLLYLMISDTNYGWWELYDENEEFIGYSKLFKAISAIKYYEARYALVGAGDYVVKPFSSAVTALSYVGDSYLSGVSGVNSYETVEGYGKVTKLTAPADWTQESIKYHWSANFVALNDAQNKLNADSNLIGVEFYVKASGNITISINGMSSFKTIECANTWTKVFLTREEVLASNCSLRKDWFAGSSAYVMISQPYALTATAIADPVIALIDALPNADEIDATDYLQLYTARTRYDALDSAIKTGVSNYTKLVAVEDAFNAQFDVVMINDMSTALTNDTGVAYDARSYHHFVSEQSEEFVYVNKMWNGDKGNMRAAITTTDLTGYTIYVNMMAGDKSVNMYSSYNGSSSTSPKIQIGEWTTKTFDGAAAGTLCVGINPWYDTSDNSQASHMFYIAPIYAIKLRGGRTLMLKQLMIWQKHFLLLKT